MGDLVTVDRLKEPGEFGRPAPVFRLRKQLSEEHVARIAKAARLRFQAKNPLADVGGGPWRVLAECPASRHNTYPAARGYARGATPGVKCICPRALAIVNDRNAQRRSEHSANKESKPRPEGKRLTWATVDAQIHNSSYYKNIKAAAIPDLSRGLCRTTKKGMEAHDRVLNSATDLAIARAKTICDYCPVMIDCLADVTRREARAGDWGGVYGGLSAAERLQRSEGRGQ